MDKAFEARSARLPRPAPGVAQIDSLQIVRGFAVVQVTWMHAGQLLADAGYRFTPALGLFGVDLFFVLSGFIMATIVTRPGQSAGAAAAWKFLKRRFIRIYPLFWLTTLVYLVRALHRGFHPGSMSTTLLLLPTLHKPYMNGLVDCAWTLVFEMVFYFVLSMLLLFTARAALAAVVLLTVMVLLGTRFDIGHPVLIYVCNPIVLEFVFGAAIALVLRRTTGMRGAGPALLLIGTTLALVSQRISPHVSTGFQMLFLNQGVMLRVATWGIAAACVIAGAALSSPNVTTHLGKLALMVGNASYSIYLWSVVVTESTYRLMTLLAPAPASEHLLPTLLRQAIMVAVCCAAGIASYVYVEWPMVRGLQAKFA